MSKNFDVAHALRHMRQESGLSILEVAEKIDALGIKSVKDKTIYNYEIGRTTPNADVFLELCVIYGCDNPMKFWDKEQLALSTDEKNLVKKYRELDGETQSDIVADITRKYDRIMDRKKENGIKTA